jgi:hypothetical protein
MGFPGMTSAASSAQMSRIRAPLGDIYARRLGRPGRGRAIVADPFPGEATSEAWDSFIDARRSPA